ncbi:precorrin-6A synthase (deacetylating) [Rhodovulum steppense]|uniref:Precorrin-6A synthase [deacetylating] n=1 Tax=Rhodovulum steppense TaxID=540251 RepID=A0A4R1YZ95_9RHOB|nr:precorrin-6A synthase (deacetylating) [Rhodovulum steppense]TCM86585.1 precorrin-6A synthase (deacetylating) [Rhodovulum steppense]
MRELTLIGIGTGNPDHLTLQGIAAIRAADLILIPRKGKDKADLADLRRDICARVLDGETARIAEFDLPIRDAEGDYLGGVEAWHDAIAQAWIAAADPSAHRVALLVWGDPSLYDSSLRIAARLTPLPRIAVAPGITAVQALCAAHRIPLNEIGAPFLVTTGRRLRETGWPDCADTVVVMLDGGCAFRTLDPEGVTIWWGAYLGMAGELTASGPLAEAGPRILDLRAAARARHGWIMDVYLLRRAG